MRDNLLLHTLRTGDTAVGYSLNGARDHETLYVSSSAGADVVFIDLEHNLTSTETVFDLVAHAHGAGLSVLVRPPQIDYAWITRLLDGGCQSLLVPHVRRRDEVEQLVDLALYQPIGRRGVALVGGANVGYSAQSTTDVMQHANANVLLGLVIETPEAVENLDDLILPDIDLLVVGRGDLAHGYGRPGDLDNPNVAAACDHVRVTCTERGISYGVFEPRLALIPEHIQSGARLVIHGGVFAFLRNSIRQLRTVTDSALSP